MAYTDNLKAEIQSYIDTNFSLKRKIHTEGVRKTAIKLATKYGADKESAEIASLFHDMFRGREIKELNRYVKKYKLGSQYINNPNLAHGKIAAIVMKDKYQIFDDDIINAVSFHTTGRAGMSQLEKVVFIADAIEPNRDYPGVDELRCLADKDLDKACLLSLNRTIDYVNKQGNFLDKDTIDARNYFLKKEKING